MQIVLLTRVMSFLPAPAIVSLPNVDVPAGISGFERVLFEFPLSEANLARILSGVWFLCSFSRLHAYYSPGVSEHRIEPSLALRQFRYYTDLHGVPIAFCNWAWLSGAVLDDVFRTGRDLKPHEFRCGDLPFFYEFLAPFGHCRAVVRELRELPSFRGRRIPAIRTKVCNNSSPVPKLKYFHF